MKSNYAHGGDIDLAQKKYGGSLEDWIDLSTGINPISYPWNSQKKSSLRDLPREKTSRELAIIASKVFKTAKGTLTLPVAGAQTAIQLLPLLFKENSDVKILSPTYNEYETCFRNFSFNVKKVYSISDMERSDVAIIVNPNNPTGEHYEDKVLDLLSKKVGYLIIDESFKSFTSQKKKKESHNIIRINSFGKFFGLAGLRLGFVSGPANLIQSLKKFIGPWQVSNLAADIGKTALEDSKWIKHMEDTLRKSSLFLKEICLSTDWELVGETLLFQTYSTKSSKKIEESFAKEKIWIRTFNYSNKMFRIGIPGKKNEWNKLKKVVKAL
jgi:cobalamin biosynthetic protein CobC